MIARKIRNHHWSNETEMLRQRLTVIGYASYSAYLRSEHWHEISRRVKQGASCFACSGRDHLQAHHKTYRRLGRERCSDLVVLCGKCHRRLHEMLGADQLGSRSLWLAARQLKERRAWPAERLSERAYCRRGHHMTGKNVYTTRGGRKRCARCRAITKRTPG